MCVRVCVVTNKTYLVYDKRFSVVIKLKYVLFSRQLLSFVKINSSASKNAAFVVKMCFSLFPGAAVFWF